MKQKSLLLGCELALHDESLKKVSRTVCLLVFAATMSACTDSGVVVANPAHNGLNAVAMTDAPALDSTTILSSQNANGGITHRVTLALSNPPDAEALYFASTDNPDNTSVLFNDVGIDGDEHAGDGLFTAISTQQNATLPALSEEATNRSANEVVTEVSPMYANRSVVGLSTEQFSLEQSNNAQSTGLTQRAKSSKSRRSVFSGVPVGNPRNIDPMKELVIIDPAILDDPNRTYDACTENGNPNGEWTVGRLFEGMANELATGMSGGDLARQWVEQMLNPGTVNGQTPRAIPIEEEVLDEWIQLSGGPGQPMDLTLAPFTLTAIVNRIDLRKERRNAGELRFVFSAYKPSMCQYSEQIARRPFNIIFEFAMPGGNYEQDLYWAGKWHNLKNYDLASEKYKTLLSEITHAITKAGATSWSDGVNGSLILKLRTNSELDEGAEWVLREFRMEQRSLQGQIVASTTDKTPMNSYREDAELSLFINEKGPFIQTNSHQVPRRSNLTGLPFRAAASTAKIRERSDPSIWTGSDSVPVDSAETRHLFSLNTCNGCHTAESATAFQHIKSLRGYGQPARLSSFMTGSSVTDAVNGTPVRSFNELQRRATDLDGLLRFPPLWQFLNQRASFTH